MSAPQKVNPSHAKWCFLQTGAVEAPHVVFKNGRFAWEGWPKVTSARKCGHRHPAGFFGPTSKVAVFALWPKSPFRVGGVAFSAPPSTFSLCPYFFRSKTPHFCGFFSDGPPCLYFALDAQGRPHHPRIPFHLGPHLGILGPHLGPHLGHVHLYMYMYMYMSICICAYVHKYIYVYV